MLGMNRTIIPAAALALALPGASCSPKQMGINRMAEALSTTAGIYAEDNDPEFVRLAAPSTLKMVEMLLEEQPSHPGLLLTACSGFTQYAYAFLHVESEVAQPVDIGRAQDLRSRGGRMYERARHYCMRALDVRHPGSSARLSKDPKSALAKAEARDVPALFWLAASWGGSMALADNQLTRIAELVPIRVLITRALTLDEGWEEGAIHEALIVLEGLPLLLGGSAERARKHFDRAVELSNGHSAFAFVTMASSVAARAGNRAEFETLLKSALAVDVDRRPSFRLANLIAQKRARFLLSRANAIFQPGSRQLPELPTPNSQPPKRTACGLGGARRRLSR